MSTKTPIPFSPQVVSESLRSIPEWTLDDGEITRTFSFKDFGEAMSFTNSVADLANRANHHPDIDIRYSKVKLALISHDAGGLTEKDFALAAQVDQLL